MTIDILKKEYPNIKVKDLNGGCNIYLPGKLILTIWFNKKKFFSNQLKVWRRYSDDKDILTIIAILGKLNIKKEIEGVFISNGENAGVQKCIEHIGNKYIKFTKENPKDHKTALMLKTIQDELYQFL